MYDLTDLTGIVRDAVAGHPVTKVILVGSYAKSNSTDISDVDLVLDGEDLSDAYWSVLFALEDRLNVPVDLMTMRGLEGSVIRDSVLEGGLLIYEA